MPSYEVTNRDPITNANTKQGSSNIRHPYISSATRSVELVQV